MNHIYRNIYLKMHLSVEFPEAFKLFSIPQFIQYCAITLFCNLSDFFFFVMRHDNTFLCNKFTSTYQAEVIHYSAQVVAVVICCQNADKFIISHDGNTD